MNQSVISSGIEPSQLWCFFHSLVSPFTCLLQNVNFFHNLWYISHNLSSESMLVNQTISPEKIYISIYIDIFRRNRFLVFWFMRDGGLTQA